MCFSCQSSWRHVGSHHCQSGFNGSRPVCWIMSSQKTFVFFFFFSRAKISAVFWQRLASDWIGAVLDTTVLVLAIVNLNNCHAGRAETYCLDLCASAHWRQTQTAKEIWVKSLLLLLLLLTVPRFILENISLLLFRRRSNKESAFYFFPSSSL